MPKTLTITLDKEYTLSYGTAALRRFETAWGKPVSHLAGADLGITEILYLIWAGMTRTHANVSLSELEDAIDAFTDSGGSVLSLLGDISECVAGSGWFANPTTGTTDSEETPSE